MASRTAILFDLDGTLLDTLHDLGASLNAVLKQHGYAAHQLEQYRAMVGDGMRMLVERALPQRMRSTARIAEVLAEFQARYSAAWHDTTAPYPGIPALLDVLTARAVPMAILSNKADEFTRDMVTQLLGRWQFVAVAGARPGVPLKPDPAAALAIARQVGIPPRQWCFVGDSGIDMSMARAADMFAVGVLWGFRPRSELQKAGAQVLLAEPAELLAQVSV
jgi:phosphoglycolate phosphatase